MSTLINNSNYTTNAKLLKQKITTDTLPVPISILMISTKVLTNTGKLVYSLMRYRNELSKKHPYKYFDRVGKFYFVTYQISELEYIMNTGKKAIRHGIAQLENLGLIIKHQPQHFGRSTHFELPRCQKGTSVSSKTGPVKRSKNPRTNRTGKTVNTQPRETQREFRPASATDLWKDSAKKMGLTLDTIDLIAEFSETYNQSAYRIAHFIKEARNIVANRYRVTKLARHFESNQNIINHLAKKLKILFSHIISKDDHKAKLTNYAGFLINSLKRFFKWTFGKGPNQTVKPKTDSRRCSGYRKWKPIKEHLPQWWKDQQSGKEKPQPTDPLLSKVIKARLALGDARMKVDDPAKPSPSHKEINRLQQNLNHCQKLYNSQHSVTKPRPKQSRHSKDLHQTSQALCDQIQTRLRRLGEYVCCGLIYPRLL